jgi:hypothetical protein
MERLLRWELTRGEKVNTYNPGINPGANAWFL